MRRLDRWLCQAFSSVPQDLQPIILIAFEIYVGLGRRRRGDIQLELHILSRLLYDLGLKIVHSGRLSQFIAFVIPRVLAAFRSESHLTPSYYTEFAVRCAKHASEAAR